MMRISRFDRSAHPTTGLLLSFILASGVLPAWASSGSQSIAQVPPASSVIPKGSTPASSPNVAAPSSFQLDPGYILGPGDQLSVDIFGLPDYSTRQTQVLADGTLNLPLVGNLSVKGLNVKQLSGILTQRYGRFIRRPILTVSITAPRPVKVAIAGEVIKAGSYTVETPRVITVTGVIQLAEGVRQSADLTQVQIRRTATAGGQPQQMTVNLLNLLETGDTSQDPLLRDGDSIFIPPVTTFDLALSSKIAGSSFVSQSRSPVRVVVNGEVFRPGPYALDGTGQGTVSSGQGTTGTGTSSGGNGSGTLPSLTRAIQSAGGITESADIRQIQISRRTSAGNLTHQFNFFDLLSSGDVNQDIPLQDGDIITVPTAVAVRPEDIKTLSTSSIAPATITVNIVGEVKRPGPIQVPPNTPLNQALLNAGGFSDDAAQGKVELIRLNPDDGTVKRQAIGVDLAKGIDSDINPNLRNNDTVIVAKNSAAKASTGIGRFTNTILPVFSFLRIFGLGF